MITANDAWMLLGLVERKIETCAGIVDDPGEDEIRRDLARANLRVWRSIQPRLEQMVSLDGQVAARRA